MNPTRDAAPNQPVLAARTAMLERTAAMRRGTCTYAEAVEAAEAYRAAIRAYGRARNVRVPVPSVAKCLRQ